MIQVNIPNIIIKYSEKLFKALNDIEYYMTVMLELFNFSDVDKEYLKKYIKALKDELIKIGYNFNDLKQFYKVCFSNMSEELINKVGTNCIGYYFGGVTLKEGKSVNELLHIIHQTIVNDECNYKNLPILSQKQNFEKYNITLYGVDNNVAKSIYEIFPYELSCGDAEIMALSNDRIIIMIRDLGHALTIEIEKENDKYYVRYFIPKICNVAMVNKLKGVNEVNDESKYTVGVFESSVEDLSSELINFICKVPTDSDMFKEGGKFYEEERSVKK